MARTQAGPARRCPDGALDRDFLRVALDLAVRGRPTTRPNPLVGCVIVRHDTIVGRGWHVRPGAPHAEVVALRDAGEMARGATAYVTLEPCDHQGRTGPCSRALLEAGISRVVFAASDPDPQAAGGARTLADGGVDVSSGVLEDEAREQNAPFFSVHERGRPSVTLKMAGSLDGRAGARDGTSQWLTGPEARAAAHQLRAEADAVLVGSGTVLADDPQLTARDVETPRGQPTACVLDTRGRIPLSAKVIRPGTLVFTTSASSPRWRADLVEAGASAVLVPDTRGDVTPEARGGVDVASVLRELASRDVQLVVAEGGPTLAAALLRQHVVDRLVLHLAPILLGGDALPLTRALGVRSLSQAQRWRLGAVRQLGPDLEVVAHPPDEAG